MRVKFMQLIVATVAIGLTAACLPDPSNLKESAKSDDDFTCVALIGAAAQLMQDRRVAQDSMLMEKGLISGMGFMNAYGVPRGIPEQQAFSDVTAKRDKIISSLHVDEIMTRAKACVQKGPV